MRRRLLLAVLIAICAATTHADRAVAQGTLLLTSDATWGAFALNPDGSQGAALGAPQGAGWSPYFVDLSPIPGSGWIWRPGVDAASPADLDGAYFVKQFDVPGAPIEAHLFVAVDDMAEVFVNGVSVGTTGSITDYSLAAGAQSTLHGFDLTSHIVAGPNTIAVKAQNGPSAFTGGRCGPCNYGGNPAGVVFGGEVRFISPVPTKPFTWGQVKALYR